jgi:hypothetical protein
MPSKLIVYGFDEQEINVCRNHHFTDEFSVDRQHRRREEAEKLPEGQGELCFALDGREGSGEDDHDKFTVDANPCGKLKLHCL